MLAAQKFAENVYYHELARSLRDFGYTILNAKRGDFEIMEIAPEICERFSKRHREIDEKTRAFLNTHPEKHGGNEKAIREHIAHTERARKNHDADSRKLLSRMERSTHGSKSWTRYGRKAECVKSRQSSSRRSRDMAERHSFERRSVVHATRTLAARARSCARDPTSFNEIKRETASREYLRSGEDKVAHRDVLAREWEIVRGRARRHRRVRTAVSESRRSRQSTDAGTIDRFGHDSLVRRFHHAFPRRCRHWKELCSKASSTSTRCDRKRVRRFAPQRQQVLDLLRDGLIGTQTVAECLQRRELPERAVVIVDEAGQLSGQQLFDLIDLVAPDRTVNSFR